VYLFVVDVVQVWTQSRTLQP